MQDKDIKTLANLIVKLLVNYFFNIFRCNNSIFKGENEEKINCRTACRGAEDMTSPQSNTKPLRSQ